MACDAEGNGGWRPPLRNEGWGPFVCLEDLLRTLPVTGYPHSTHLVIRSGEGVAWVGSGGPRRASWFSPDAHTALRPSAREVGTATKARTGTRGVGGRGSDARGGLAVSPLPPAAAGTVQRRRERARRHGHWPKLGRPFPILVTPRATPPAATTTGAGTPATRQRATGPPLAAAASPVTAARHGR